MYMFLLRFLTGPDPSHECLPVRVFNPSPGKGSDDRSGATSSIPTSEDSSTLQVTHGTRFRPVGRNPFILVHPTLTVHLCLSESSDPRTNGLSNVCRTSCATGVTLPVPLLGDPTFTGSDHSPDVSLVPTSLGRVAVPDPI